MARAPKQKTSSSSRDPSTTDGLSHGDVPRPPTGLKKFVNEYKGKQHRVIETRIVLVSGFAVLTKVLFSDMLAEVKGKDATYTALTFATLCVLVTVFNTWLDYFPSRLTNIQLRVTEGQGLPLGCLLLPMVCASAIHCALLTNSQLIGVLFLYLVILCQLSLCSVVATLLNSIPHPNSIVIYNFLSIGISYFFYWWIATPMWVSLPAIIVFSVFVPWLVTTFPKSFSLGEAVIVSQGLTMMFLDTALQLVAMYNLVQLPSSISLHRSVSVNFVQLLLTGVAVCCVLLSPALFQIVQSKHHHDNKFWSGTFILLSLSIGFVAVLPWLGSLIGGNHPIPFVFFYMSRTYTRLALVGYWLVVSIATGVLVYAQSSTGLWARTLKAEQPSSLWMRKWFHLSALLVFVPGLALDANFTSFAASMVTFIFVVAELMRLLSMWPCGESLKVLLQPMCDQRDSGLLVLSHLYLLAGFALPLWLSPLQRYDNLMKLSLYSGVLALGVGDSMAALSGQLFGRFKWPGTTKTVEGSVMSVLTQMLVVAVIVVIDSDIVFPSLREWLVVSGGVVITALLEAYTLQIDNLILSQVQFTIFMAFL